MEGTTTGASGAFTFDTPPLGDHLIGVYQRAGWTRTTSAGTASSPVKISSSQPHATAVLGEKPAATSNLAAALAAIKQKLSSGQAAHILA